MSPHSRLVAALTVLFGVSVLGTLGYMALEGAGLADSFYMTIITISTVGYQEVFPLSETGRVFTAFIIVGGVGVGPVSYTHLTLPTN